jgi:hypothetical protein
VLVTVRQAAVHLHHRDRLMHVAFAELGSLPMSLIKNYRDARLGVRAGGGGCSTDGC